MIEVTFACTCSFYWRFMIFKNDKKNDLHILVYLGHYPCLKLDNRPNIHVNFICLTKLRSHAFASLEFLCS